VQLALDLVVGRRGQAGPAGGFVDDRAPGALEELVLADNIARFQGLEVSSGPMYISYRRMVSAPNSAMGDDDDSSVSSDGDLSDSDPEDDASTAVSDDTHGNRPACDWQRQLGQRRSGHFDHSW